MSEATNNQAQQDMTTLINHMKVLGWEQLEGRVEHEQLGLSYPNWVSAIKACIEIGSGY